MKTVTAIGVLLLLVGVLSLVYQGIRYTSRDTVVAAGSIKVTAERDHAMPLSPLLGIGALVAGVVLLKVGTRKQPML